MKIYCPIDFSPASLNALQYAVALGQEAGASLIEISHCIVTPLTTSTGTDNGNPEHKASQELKNLVKKYQVQTSVKIDSSLFKGHPLDIIPAYLTQTKHDLIVVGTKGLTAVRDLTVGSFTEDLIFNLETPILVVPKHFVFEKLRNVVLAVDEKLFTRKGVVHVLHKMGKDRFLNLHVVHVKNRDESTSDFRGRLQKLLDPLPFHLNAMEDSGAFSDDLDRFCTDRQADILCMVHKDRGWMINIFHHSLVKEQLFHLKTPLLVLQD